MRKLTIAIVVFTAAAIMMFSAFENIFQYRNLLIIEYTDNLTWIQKSRVYKFLADTPFIYDISAYGICSEKIDLQVSGRVINDVSVIEVDGDYTTFQPLNIILGRFISNKDIEAGMNYAVIEKRTAERLFGTLNCLGRSLEIKKGKYNIIGVYEKNHSLWDFMSLTNKNVLFVPTANYTDQTFYNKSIIMVRTDPGISSIYSNYLEGSLSGFFENGAYKVSDLELKAGLALQKIKLCLLFSLFMVLLLIAKFTIRRWKILVFDIQTRLKSEYFKDILPGLALQVIPYVLALAILITGFLKLVSVIDYSPVADPDLIPSTLMDTNEVIEKLQDYIIRRNSNPEISEGIVLKLDYISKALNILCVIAISSLYVLLRTIWNYMDGEKQQVKEGTDCL